jgi:signal transduction histidine kinase
MQVRAAVRSEEVNAPVAPGAERTHALARAVREAASEATELVGDGRALVFGAAPGQSGIEASSQLRAAAGFASPGAAREAAPPLLPAVRAALADGQPREVDPALVPGAGAVCIHPLVCGERVHGALVVACADALEPACERAVARLARFLGLCFDHAQQSAELAELRGRLDSVSEGSDERSEEILKLSEALFAQDIELLRNNEKLGKIEKLKNDFIEKMSRELRTPLNRIIEATISVLTGENEALSEDAKTALRGALDDGTSFLRTLQNILDLWRLKQGELPVEIQEVNFRETVDEAIFSVQDAIGNKPLRIELGIEEPFPKIRTDLTKISQILFLLLDNAVKFTPRGQVSISARVEDGQLHCEVRDTGIGICADDQQCVFDEFFQVAEPSSRRYQGAGLGLTLVRDLVLLLDGEISISSEVGAGSAFRFSVPVQIAG